MARGRVELLVIGREAYTLLMDEVPGFARALLAVRNERRTQWTCMYLDVDRLHVINDNFGMPRDKNTARQDCNPGIATNCSCLCSERQR